jgi:hypothetical protein
MPQHMALELVGEAAIRTRLTVSGRMSASVTRAGFCRCIGHRSPHFQLVTIVARNHIRPAQVPADDRRNDMMGPTSGPTA